MSEDVSAGTCFTFLMGGMQLYLWFDRFTVGTIAWAFYIKRGCVVQAPYMVMGAGLLPSDTSGVVMCQQAMILMGFTVQRLLLLHTSRRAWRRGWWRGIGSGEECGCGLGKAGEGE
ncbi:hypothetical protein DM02DRAFT_658976 [Periconia macrospinosa]|uniref:Uncharacterized protein n=1 Tax=Periconia macrospinosa TaxID=97972 RepID=A0A2V1DGH3_9PLEO|nr:hypothetical protein DM02DRAFT_658976 [Periconia macrospinosa]